MDLKGQAKRAVERATGFTVTRAGSAPEPATGGGARRPGGAGRSRRPRKGPPQGAASDVIRPPREPQIDRLLTRPIFILSPVRSGSTLLRYLLNAHSELHAPHELHLRRIAVEFETGLARTAMAELGHNKADLEHLLWDRVLHLELMRSGKKFIVEKTPGMAFAHQRIAACWPDARFIFLIRHPASIVQSWEEAGGNHQEFEKRTAVALGIMRAVQRARERFDGLTVRYEDLTSDPASETQRICDYLSVTWEPGMLDYGQDGVFVRGLGDWTDKIRSGSVQSGRDLPRPDQVPDQLLDISRAWGYV
jgi:hypothetical protein